MKPEVKTNLFETSGLNLRHVPVALLEEAFDAS